MEGEAYQRLNQRIAQIQGEKEEIEKLKKNRRRETKGSKVKQLPLVPDAFGVME